MSVMRVCIFVKLGKHLLTFRSTSSWCLCVYVADRWWSFSESSLQLSSSSLLVSTHVILSSDPAGLVHGSCAVHSTVSDW